MRAEDAAIPLFRLQHHAAPFALIKVLARVLVHTFAFVMTACRTHYRGYQLNHDWPRIGKKEDAPQAAAVSSLPRYSRQRAESINQTSESVTCSLPSPSTISEPADTLPSSPAPREHCVSSNSRPTPAATAVVRASRRPTRRHGASLSSLSLRALPPVISFAMSYRSDLGVRP